MKKVSIIIPCYNVISTIDNCMQCLINQTIGIENMEIILVDDASTDSTLDKLCKWEELYPESVLVIHCEENGKPGQARNIGLQYATADYIGYMDDDDWIEPKMYESLYNAVTEHSCDLAICQSVRQNFFIQDIQQPAASYEIIEIHDEAERHAFLQKDFNNAVWNKLYSRSILVENDIFFPANTYYEDMLFTNLLKHYCNKIYITNQIYYHHIIQISSISNSDNPEKRFQFIEVIMMLIEELRNRTIYQTYSGWYDNYFVMQYVSFMANYTNLFGEMPTNIFEILQQSIFELFPHFTRIPVVKAFLQDDSTPEFQSALQRLLQNSPLPKVSRVLVLKGMSRYGVLRDFADAMVQAFQNLSVPVDVFDGADKSNLTKQALHCLIQDYDLVLSFNGILNDSLDAFLHNTNTLFWSFLVDHPYYHHTRLLENCPNHFVSCVDNKHIVYIDKYYPDIKQRCFLPHGGNLPNTTPKPYAERTYSVVFMGSYGDINNLKRTINELPDLVRMIVVNVINRYYESPNQTLEDLFQSEFARFQLTFSDNEFAGLLNELTMVDKYIRLKNRELLLDSLLSQGITIDLFGSGWEHYNCKHPEHLQIHGELSYSEILDTLCDSKIVLNALPLFLDGSHERVFTSMLCGAVCLSERNTYLEHEFDDGTNICFFEMSELAHLGDTIQNLLSDSKKAEHIAMAGQQLATERHTWNARAKQILEIVENHLS